ncbi:hypothetical protein GWD52_14135 [Enterobacteriaceae bacterium 4M9]|nr:hypothetical protein [Enterobacteriaceae bacterium 4M9]
MKTENPIKLNCYGCEYKCRDMEPQRVRITHCAQTKILMWPEDNYFFKRAMKELVANIVTSDSSGGAILVDFSIDNLLYFIQDAWLDFLKQCKMHIVLLCDREMLSLARYWLNREWRVISVIDATGDTQKMILNINDILNWKSVPPPKGKTITDNEVKTLFYMSKGKSMAHIASVLECSIKSAYGYRYSLCKKFGGLEKISDLRFKHQIV